MKKQEKLMTAEIEHKKCKMAALEAKITSLEEQTINNDTNTDISDDENDKISEDETTDQQNVVNAQEKEESVDDGADVECLEESGIFDVASMEHSLVEQTVSNSAQKMVNI